MVLSCMLSVLQSPESLDKSVWMSHTIPQRHRCKPEFIKWELVIIHNSKTQINKGEEIIPIITKELLGKLQTYDILWRKT